MNRDLGRWRGSEPRFALWHEYHENIELPRKEAPGPARTILDGDIEAFLLMICSALKSEQADAMPASPDGCASFAMAAGEMNTGKPTSMPRIVVAKLHCVQSLKTRWT